MKTVFRYLPIGVLSLFVVTILSLQSCSKKQEQPQSVEQKVDSTMNQSAAASGEAAPAAPAPTSADSWLKLDDEAKKGQAIYYNKSLGKIGASCAMCHSDGTSGTKDGKTRPGHTLAGVASRTSTWNGKYKGADLKKYAYGGSLCAAGFLKSAKGDVTKALSTDQVMALNAYFAAIDNAPTAMKKNLKIQWIAAPIFSEDSVYADKLADPVGKAIMKLPGDPGKGQAVFEGTCSGCHDIDQKKVGPSMKKVSQEDAKTLAEDIRMGSVAMPFFAKDVLSDQQIADVLAYIESAVKK